MRIQRIIALIDKCNAKLIVLLCHHNADPDAVCAAFAFSRLLKRLRPKLNLEIAAAKGPSRLTKFMLKSLPIKLTTHPHIEKADVIVLLDTNTIQQLDEWSERVRTSNSPLIIVDHHARHPETEQLATICVSEEVASTCEIVYQFFKEAEVNLEQPETKALFLGIAFDTKHFILATSATLKTVADLVDSGVNVQETLSLLSLPMTGSERIARLKASRRARLLKVEKWMIALSHVSSYQSSAARALIRLGADVAVVLGQRGDEIQVSLRSNRDFHKETGIHLGRDIAKPLGEYLHGMGGGHSVSAGANGIGEVKRSLKRCAQLLKEKLK